jgi:hypothetical protein
MPWSMVKMKDRDISDKQDTKLQLQFEAIYSDAGAPPEAAMFGNLITGEDDHVFFFSPVATEIARDMLSTFSSEECAAPDPHSVYRLVGNEPRRDLSDL